VGAGRSVDRWGLVAERGVSPAVVVVRLPVADHHACLCERPEHVDVEAFVAHPAVQRLDIAVAPGLAGWEKCRPTRPPAQSAIAAQASSGPLCAAQDGRIASAAWSSATSPDDT